MARKIIKISGVDAQNFLQNLITNNLNLCTEENPIYSCLLNPKGRYQFDFFVIKIADYFLIDIAETQAIPFISSLSYRKLISKVAFEVLENYKVYNTKSKIEHAVDNVVASYKDPRLDGLGYRSIFKGELPAEFNSILLLNYDETRYKNAIIQGNELTFDKSIPIECGMDELGAIAYNKGCYLGQEFSNSAKNRMAIRKRIISISANFLLAKDDVLVNENGVEVGKVVSSLVLDSESSVGSKNYLNEDTPTALALFKMAHKNEKIFINGKEVEKHIPNWIKIYSRE